MGATGLDLSLDLRSEHALRGVTLQRRISKAVPAIGLQQ